MKKTIYTLAILSSIFVSCNGDLKDDIDDLETSLSELQAENDALNEIIESSGIEGVQTIDITHEYSFDDNNPIIEDITWSGLTYPYYELYDNGDDTYNIYIYIEDYQSDVNHQGDIEIDINDYNPVTGDFYLSDLDFDLDENIYGDYVSLDIYENTSYATTTITINSFDADTGEVSFEATTEYSGDYEDSEYNTSGVLTVIFDGILPLREQEPITLVSK